ncbi:SDR family oxidoreductase [Paenibacillus taiwanensis]|uniref:SDR family oxidoreductase n=1 Tax=Paenibacillus taiwanensis TaxID=401638 RepID=UPI000407644F|nr:SDR family oxidoreductase [Paenibacillus taiwanensis]
MAHAKTVWITGAASGFGLLTAAKLAQSGYVIVATTRQADARREQITQFISHYTQHAVVHVWELDVRHEEQAQQIAKQIIDLYGKIDIVINNAGYAAGGFVEDVPMQAWREQFDTNVFGAIQVCKAAIPYMREAQSGCLIQISSISGRMGFPGLGAYVASKFALEGYSEALCLEMAPYGVDVVLVEPGSYRTNIWERSLEQMHAPEGSPNHYYAGKLLASMQQNARTAPEPDPVVNLIVKIANTADGKRKLRYPIGKGVRAVLFSRMLLPWNVFERMLWKAIGVVIRRNRHHS